MHWSLQLDRFQLGSKVPEIKSIKVDKVCV
jgi:hypothetical protein